MYNTTFQSVAHGQRSQTVFTASDPSRTIDLEVNDTKPIASGTTYSGSDISISKVYLTYTERFGSGSTQTIKSWIANGGTVSFENVGNGQATYRIRGATFVLNPNYSANAGTGTFTLDAVGTANPFTS